MKNMKDIEEAIAESIMIQPWVVREVLTSLKAEIYTILKSGDGVRIQGLVTFRRTPNGQAGASISPAINKRLTA